MNSVVNSETFKRPKGEISMYMHKGGYINAQGECVGGELINQHHVHNLIVNSASLIMAGRMAPGAITGSNSAALTGNFLDDGLKYLALGTGPLQDPSLPYDATTNPVDTSTWDLLNPPAEAVTDVKLTAEGFRKEFTSWCFVDSAGNETSTITNILKLTTRFESGEANFPINDMGIFGGDAKDWNNGAGKDSGTMFNHKVIPVWTKTSDAELTIVWKITF